MKPTENQDPIAVQERKYNLPYHWFPRRRLLRFEREEKERIVFDLINRHHQKPVGRYLDVGCGDGRWTYEISTFLETGADTYGIDFSEQAIGFARLINPHLHFSVQAGENIDFPDQYFDLVSTIEVIEHVEDGKEEAFLAELRRVMADDGLLILTTPSWNLKVPPHHFRHYTVERLQELLQEAGFECLECRGQSLPWYGFKRTLRGELRDTPLLWKLFKHTYREVDSSKALNLILAARPA
jgi:SAM-dependent methyltransferase